ncbi:MAG: DUF5686 and carboxypeptidase regulatory-like domain-containing protein [Bacteroidota bacterium]
MKILFSLTFILLTTFVNAQNYSISGNITDNKGEPLPYTNIIITGTSEGTSANFQGEYLLELPKGKHSLTYQFIGFESQAHEIDLTNGDVEFDVSLREEILSLKEVVVNANGEDPAYEIIRNAQKKRKDYLNEFKDYEHAAYTKIFAKAEREGASMTLFGTLLQSTPGIFYLSESMSNIRFTGQDQRTETLTASILSGDTSKYSANKANFLQFYGNRTLRVNTLSFVSPIANDAFSFYEYEFEGFFMENEKLINKIKVTPKYPSLPAFSGHIYIIEDSWRIYGVHVFISANASGIGEIELKVAYVELNEKNTWVPFSVDFNVEASNSIDAYYHTVQSDYNFDISNKEPLPTGLRYRIADGARSKSNEFWADSRPIPLTDEETETYQKDALTKPAEDLNTNIPTNQSDSTAVADSVKQKRFSLASALLNENIYKLSNYWTLNTQSIFNQINFNTVEGAVINIRPRFERTAASTRKSVIIPEIRYGFSSKRFYGKVSVEQELNLYKPSKISLAGGHYIDQISGFQSISPLNNTFYSLVLGENYMKIFEKTFVQVRYKKELFNGFDLTLSSEYANRSPLTNSNDFSFRKEENLNYTANAAVINGNELDFTSNSLFKVGAMISFAIARPYNELPARKEILNTVYPIIKLAYEYGGDESNYQFIWANVQDSWRIGTAGTSSLSASYGRFLQNTTVFATEFFHFSGNRTVFQNNNSNFNLRYQLLDYYDYSTADEFFGANYRHGFNGSVLQKLPLIRQTKASLALSVNYLKTANRDHYVEAGIGIENILGAFNISYYRSFSNENTTSDGIIVGILVGQ